MAAPNSKGVSVANEERTADSKRKLPSTETVGGIPSADIRLGKRWRLSLEDAIGAKALRAGSGRVEECLEGDDLLHVGSACKKTVTLGTPRDHRLYLTAEEEALVATFSIAGIGERAG